MNIETSHRKAGTFPDRILKRLPNWNDVLAVFGIAVFVCFTWSLLGFFNKLSSFLLYFTLAEIGDIFAFMMAFALLESLAITGLLCVVSMILPSGWLRDGFALKGFIILVIATVTSILFQKTLDEYPSPLLLTLTVLIPISLSAAVILGLRSLPRIKNILANIQDRILIMLFIYVPIGLVSLAVVLYRNLL